MKISSDLGRAFTRVQMKMQLEEMEGFIKSTEIAFKKQLRISEKKWDKSAPKGLDEDELQAYYHEISMEAHSLRSGFPDLVRSTTFIHLWSVLEKSLLLRCQALHSRNPKLPTPDDGKDKGIVKAQKYFKQVRIAFPDKTAEWNEIKLMGELRNRLVHSIGTPLKKALEQYCRSKKRFVRVGYHGSITLNAGYCEHTINVVRRFYDKLVAAIPDMYFEAEWPDSNDDDEE